MMKLGDRLLDKARRHDIIQPLPDDIVILREMWACALSRTGVTCQECVFCRKNTTIYNAEGAGQLHQCALCRLAWHTECAHSCYETMMETAASGDNTYEVPGTLAMGLANDVFPPTITSASCELCKSIDPHGV